MTCYYIENANKDNRNYDSYVPVEQMGEVLTAAMLQVAVEKFGKDEFTRRQFNDLRESFNVNRTTKRFNLHKYGYGHDIGWEDFNYNCAISPMSFDALRERGVFEVKRFEGFDLETEDGTVAGKRNFYKLNMRKLWATVSEMMNRFAHNISKSGYAIENNIKDISCEIEDLQKKLEHYQKLLDKKNEQEVEIVRDAYDCYYGWTNDDNCEKEFDKYVNAVIEKHVA